MPPVPIEQEAFFSGYGIIRVVRLETSGEEQGTRYEEPPGQQTHIQPKDQTLPH